MVIFNFWIIAFIKLEHTITEMPKTATTNSTVLMDKTYELLNNIPTLTEVTEIQSNTIREVFNFLKLTLKPNCRATMDNGDKYVAPINMLAIVPAKRVPISPPLVIE